MQYKFRMLIIRSPNVNNSSVSELGEPVFHSVPPTTQKIYQSQVNIVSNFIYRYEKQLQCLTKYWLIICPLNNMKYPVQTWFSTKLILSLAGLHALHRRPHCGLLLDVRLGDRALAQPGPPPRPHPPRHWLLAGEARGHRHTRHHLCSERLHATRGA